MSSKPNTSFAIGLFIVGALLLVFFALLFFSGGRLFAHKDKVIMYFDGSVQGLQVGAPVKLKGVVLGEISDIQINFQNDNKTVVTAVTAELAMKRINIKGAEAGINFLTDSIKNGLRAQLNFQSFLTGLLYVELDFYPETQAKLYNLQKGIVELPTMATNFEAISKTLQEMNLTELVSNVNNLIKETNNIISSGQIQKTLVGVNSAANSIEKTSNNINKEFPKLSQQLSATLTNVDQLILQLNTQTPKVSDALLANLNALHQSLDTINAAATTLNNQFSDDSSMVYQFNTTLEEISRTAVSLRGLSETLEQQPEALIRGKQLPAKGE